MAANISKAAKAELAEIYPSSRTDALAELSALLHTAGSLRIGKDKDEAFLATDGILDLYINIASGLVVYPKVIRSRLMSELPFMATENILMDAVKKGGDRQALHERIRVHSLAAADTVKMQGGKNDLIDRLANDPAFNMTKEEILATMEPENFIGRAPQQTADFLEETVKPILEANKDLLGIDVEINV